MVNSHHFSTGQIYGKQTKIQTGEKINCLQKMGIKKSLDFLSNCLLIHITLKVKLIQLLFIEN